MHRFFLFVFASLLSHVAFASTSVELENTTASLIVSHNTLQKGGAFSAAVILKPKAGWHTYWENPGDAGIPTTLEWSLPEGLSAGPVQWPMPTRLMEDTLAVYAYESEVLLPVIIQLPMTFDGASVPITVNASWLVCDKICVPESAELSTEIPIGSAGEQSNDLGQFANAWASLPTKRSAAIAFSTSEQSFDLEIPEDVRGVGEIYFFPRQQNIIEYATPQTISGRTLSLPRKPGSDVPDTISGYLRVGDKYYDLTANNNGAVASAAPIVPAPSPYSFPGLLLFALLGGLILNLMPCVLPVLSLKALAIAKKSGHDSHVVVKQALAYTLGVVMSFVVIAAILISLQMAGESIGWGFQMQSPPFVGFLTILLFLVGLNLAGMFELPVLFGTVLLDTRQHNLRGSFLTGVLATAVAAPCTAPFMATAVGATLTLPPAMSLCIFMAIGLGLALPFLLIAIFPRAVRYLPRPGAWMETFRQLMAFPMFASVIWLLWVLTQQAGATGLLVILVTMLAIAFIIWLKGRCHDASIYCRGAIVLLLLAALFNGLSALSMAPKNEFGDAFSEATLSELRTNNVPVFVDATAAWCLTCQLNAKTAIRTEAVRAAFEETGTKLLIADWTNRNKEVTAFLKRFGYNGVPLYVYYPASGDPIVLPQILSESLVISTLKGEKP